MKNLFLPDIMVKDVYSIDYEELIKNKKKLLIFDIDNTLAPYEIAVPDEKLYALFDYFKTNGLIFAFVSNNGDERVSVFNEKLCAYYICNAKKPKAEAYIKILEKYGLKPEQAAAIGDQIFTDVLAANRAGIYSILVPPIKDKTTLFFKIKRFLEKPFIKKYRRLHNKNMQKEELL